MKTIKIELLGFTPGLQKEVRELLGKYKVKYFSLTEIIIYNANEELIEQLELWGIIIEELI